jgi:hypothetical protein
MILSIFMLAIFIIATVFGFWKFSRAVSASDGFSKKTFKTLEIVGKALNTAVFLAMAALFVFGVINDKLLAYQWYIVALFGSDVLFTAVFTLALLAAGRKRHQKKMEQYLVQSLGKYQDMTDIHQLSFVIVTEYGVVCTYEQTENLIAKLVSEGNETVKNRFQKQPTAKSGGEHGR